MHTLKKMLWGGRFKGRPAHSTIEFNSSENVQLDQSLIQYDILGNIAHVTMLERQGIITKSEAHSIRASLRSIFSRWRKGRFILDNALEDVHMNIEAAVSAETDAGKKMHTARSRNDQVLLDMRLLMRDQLILIVSVIQKLSISFSGIARRGVPMVSYTHTRIAQPITLSFWCDGWVKSFQRDVDRLQDAYERINQNPLGACAIAGTPWNIDRKYTAKLLAFKSVQENELDTISSRGECETELIADLSLIMCKLSRLSEELIWLSQKGLIVIAEKHTTGSSIMPNKKNPDILELIRGRSARVYGNLMHTLGCLKGLSSGYHSDMQETKFALISGCGTTISCVIAMSDVISGISFNSELIRKELDENFAQATEVADFLAMAGMPFRVAHERSGALVKHCEKGGKTISGLSASEARSLLLLNFSDSDWKKISSLERPRLERSVHPIKCKYIDSERARIQKVFSVLIEVL